jgi:spermidine/putrescine transport system permease protein
LTAPQETLPKSEGFGEERGEVGEGRKEPGWAGRRGGLDRGSTFWVLYLPPLLWLGLFFIVPLLLMGAFSFRENLSGGILRLWTPTFAQYAKLFATLSYWRLLGLSILVALIVALCAVVLAYPTAYFIVFKAGKRSGLYLILLLIPFWTSYLLRVMAWKLMLGSEGVINSLLNYLGLIRDPIPLLLYSRTAVGLTLVYVWIPFITLPIFAALQRIDPALLEAASDLGAPPGRAFWRITFPLSIPGVIAGFFMVFIPTVGEYVTPLLVGGSRGSLYGNIIQDFFTKAANWPFGSAMSMVMLTLTLALLAVAVRLVNLRELFE